MERDKERDRERRIERESVCIYPGVGWVLRWLIKPIFAFKVLGQSGQGSAVGS